MTSALTSLATFCIALAVLLSGVQAKELFGIRYVADPNKRTAAEDHPFKVSQDQHTHVDKQVLKNILRAEQAYRADTRSRYLLSHRLVVVRMRLALYLRSFMRHYLRVSYA